jgi:hypothetical protein
MAKYNDILNYFKTLAQSNNNIAHGVQVDGVARVSFFTVDDIESLQAAQEVGIHLPCLVMIDLRGKLIDRDGDIKKQWFHELYFLNKINSSIAEITAKNNCYRLTETIMNQFISKIWNDFEEDGNCATLIGLDLSSFVYNMIGEVGDGLFGWKLTFNNQTKAADILEYDEDNWTSTPPLDGGENSGGEVVYNFNGYNYNPSTGLLTFSLPSDVEENPDENSLLEVVFFDADDPEFGYVNAEGNSFSTSPSATNTILAQYFTPGVVGIKWRKIAGAPSYAPLTTYTNINLTVSRISSRWFKLCIEDSLVGVNGAQFPITPLNVNGDQLADVADIDEYITVMNADTANQAAFNINTYRQFPANGTAQYYELLLEPTAPYQEWLFNRKLEAII